MISLPPTSITYRPRPTNPTPPAESGQTLESSVEGRGPRPTKFQPEYKLHVEGMHGVFPSVRAPARCVFFPPAGPRTRTVHCRDWTCTTATTCHWGGRAQNGRWLRRNNFGVRGAHTALAAIIINEYAAKHNFIDGFGSQRSQQINNLHVAKYV